MPYFNVPRQYWLSTHRDILAEHPDIKATLVNELGNARNWAFNDGRGQLAGYHAREAIAPDDLDGKPWKSFRVIYRMFQLLGWISDEQPAATLAIPTTTVISAELGMRVHRTDYAIKASGEIHATAAGWASIYSAVGTEDIIFGRRGESHEREALRRAITGEGA